MEKKKYFLGNLIIVILTGIAVLLWVISPSVSLEFSNLSDIMLNLGKLFGIVGIMLFALSLILSARLHILEKLFMGLNQVYVNHSKIGQISLILLMFHPIFLLSDYAGGTFGGVLNFLLPSEDVAKNFGIFSLGLMILLLIITLYFHIKYNIWKWTHKFMGLAFFFGVIHVLLISSDTSSFLPLRLYVIIICAIALYLYLYRTVFGKFTTHKYKYVISKVNTLNDAITEIILTSLGEKMDFKAGQFVFVNFNDKNLSKESHPFSISSGEEENTISLTIKNLGDYTSDIAHLAPGVEVLLEGPFGKFSYKNSIFKKQIWIAGGIGITPFLSMAKSIKKDEGYYIDLYYCVNEEKEAVNLNELKSLSERNGINIIPFFSKEKGRINASLIKEKSKTLEGKSIFLCAPPVMINSLKTDFIKNGVKKGRLFSEEFNF